jgi:hypothetical protein
MRKITITSSNGSSIEISLTLPYILQKLEGLGIPENSTEKLKSPDQDGTSWVQTLLDSRSIELEFGILTTTDVEKFNLRENVSKVFNPKYELDILYEYPGGKKRITGHLDGPLNFAKSDDRRYQKVLALIECNEPFWRDEEDSEATLTLEEPGFKFPLVFNPSIVFGVIANNTVVINTVGHVPSPVNIKFIGPATNPIVTNDTSGEFIKVNKVLASNEMLEINTAFGNKYVLFGEYQEVIQPDGSIEYEFVSSNPENAFGFIDPDSTFFQLMVGDNIITFNDDTQSEDAILRIKYNNLYTGV